MLRPVAWPHAAHTTMQPSPNRTCSDLESSEPHLLRSGSWGMEMKERGGEGHTLTVVERERCRTAPSQIWTTGDSQSRAVEQKTIGPVAGGPRSRVGGASRGGGARVGGTGAGSGVGWEAPLGVAVLGSETAAALGREAIPKAGGARACERRWVRRTRGWRCR